MIFNCRRHFSDGGGFSFTGQKKNAIIHKRSDFVCFLQGNGVNLDNRFISRMLFRPREMVNYTPMMLSAASTDDLIVWKKGRCVQNETDPMV